MAVDIVDLDQDLLKTKVQDQVLVPAMGLVTLNATW